jgi:hypothetical protein
MDIEASYRSALIEALGEDFDCVEHVPLRHVFLRDKTIVCDVLARPKDSRYDGLTFAFEVKCPDKGWLPSEGVICVPFWTRAIKQAADYVYAEVVPGSAQSLFAGRRVGCAFVFPANLRRGRSATEHDLRAWGAFEAACHFRVGHASLALGRKESDLSLHLGTDLWASKKGFSGNAAGVLRGKRPLGSQQVDVLSALSGLDVPGGP